MRNEHETKRKGMEASLRESEERLRAFMDSAPYAFAVFDSGLNLTTINKVGLGMLPAGTKREDVIGKNLRDFSPKFKEKGRIDKYLEVVRTGKPVFIEDASTGGDYGNVHLSVSAFKVGDGLGIIATDITERNEAHEALRESEQKYRTLVANIPDVVWRTDSEGNTVFISPNVEGIYGYSPDEICSQGEVLWSGRIHPDDAERFRKAFDALLEDNTQFDLEYRIKRRDGEWVWLHDRSIVTSEIEGVRHADGILTDITKRKEAEQEARESQTLIQGILDNTGSLIVVRDTQGRYLLVNKQVEDVLGMRSDEIIGKTPFEIHSKGQADKILADDKRVIDSGRLLAIEDELEVQGQTRTFLGSKFPLLDAAGVPYAVCTVVADITDRKKAEEAVLAERNKLQSIAETIECGLTIRDLEYNLTYQNSYLTRIFGEHLGEKCYRVLVGEEEICEGCPVEMAFKDGKSHTSIRRVVMPSGKIGYWENVASPIRDAEGNIISCLEVSTYITDRKKAQEALKASEEKFRMIAEQSFDAVTIADMDGTLTYASPSVLRVFGYHQDEMIGMKVAQFVCESEMPKVIQQFKDIAAGKSIEGQEVRILRKDGSIGVIELNSCPVVRDGKVVGAQASARDITQRKEAEDALKESEEKFRRITEHSFDVVLAADLNGILTYASPSVIRVFGYTPDEMVGRGPADFMPESSMERVKQMLSELAGGKDSVTGVEIDHLKKDGTFARIELNCVPVRKDGEVIGAQASLRDITERKRAEAALRESEERYRTVVENAGETIAVVGREGVFQFINKTGAERLGGKPEDYVGKTMRDVFPKETADRQLGSVRAVINTGRGMNFVAPTELQGRMRWYNTTIEPLRGGSGEVAAVLIIGRDIHEMRQAEMELEAYSEKMTQAERLASLGTISATLAHELTQPLTVISLSLEDSLTELEGVSCSPAVIEGLRDSLSEVVNVTTIVERFRNFARKSSAKTVDKVELKVVAERIVKLLSRSAQQAAVKLRLKGMDKLPIIYFNEKELEQLFFALVQNSIQAADGKEPHNLVVEGTVKKEYIELRFKDDCGGVRQEDVDNIFEPFFSTKPAGEGTGLGLCIVQRVAERSGGKVRVENRPGEGVTIVVTLGISEKRTF